MPPERKVLHYLPRTAPPCTFIQSQPRSFPSTPLHPFLFFIQSTCRQPCAPAVPTCFQHLWTEEVVALLPLEESCCYLKSSSQPSSPPFAVKPGLPFSSVVAFLLAIQWDHSFGSLAIHDSDGHHTDKIAAPKMLSRSTGSTYIS